MDPIAELLTSYTDLNVTCLTELDAEPSPLQFMRFVALNVPFVVRDCTLSSRATELWGSSYFRSRLKSQIINVAVTPTGNADSPVGLGDGTLRFVKPLEEAQHFEEFLDYIIGQELQGTLSGDVRYSQTQNDNLHGEFASLAGDIERDVPWARIALQKMPEAVNLWLGNSRKHFVLLPPISSPCVGEQVLKPASYIREHGKLSILDEDGPAVRFPTWDPDNPKERATKYSNLASPVCITLEPGDILYLPALWYHKVSQSCSSEGLCCAVNYWYDMFSYSGSFLPQNDFVRNVANFAN